MKLIFDNKVSDKYTSPSQKIRVLTEHWVYQQIYCPNCGNLNINKYPNNRPAADFYCPNCKEDYELKSKKENIGLKIVDGAYSSMIKRLQSSSNPNFFFLNYNVRTLEVFNFLVIPKHFFTPQIIEKRKPLSQNAQRAGWIGCNILLKNIPQSGKIFFVRNRIVEPKNEVLSQWKKTLFLREEKEINTKGWILDVMACVDKLRSRTFSLAEMYAFEKELSKRHPNNQHIKEKIRQQLQLLRDKGYLYFVNRGLYRLT